MVAKGMTSLRQRYRYAMLKGCSCAGGNLIGSNAQLKIALKNHPETRDHTFQCHVKELSSSFGLLLL